MLISFGLDQHVEDLALSVDGSPDVDHPPIDFQIVFVSIQGGITGYGYDFIIIDDPIKASVAHSKVERRRLEELYANSVANGWRDPTKGVLIVVMQCLHVDDFTALLPFTFLA